MRLYDPKLTQEHILEMGIFDEKKKGYVIPIVPIEEKNSEDYYKKAHGVVVEEEEKVEEQQKESEGEGK